MTAYQAIVTLLLFAVLFYGWVKFMDFVFKRWAEEDEKMFRPGFDDVTPAVCTCIGCGCDDLHACVSEEYGACYWLRVDEIAGVGVCSSEMCERMLPLWDQGERSIQ